MKQYKFTINGKSYEVAIDGIEGRTARVTVNGSPYEVELEDDAPAAHQPETSTSPSVSTQRHSGPVPDSSAPVTSPLPGVIIEVCVKEGQAVKAGQKVAVLEAMKMENEISADKDGTVTAVHVSRGDSVLEGATIVTIA